MIRALSIVVALGVAVVTLAAQTKHWAYEDHGDEVGPAKWGTLPGDEACGSGKQQTPINLAAGVAKPQDLPNLVFAYKPSKLSMTNNGHTVQMTYDAGSTLGRAGSTSHVDARAIPLPCAERTHGRTARRSRWKCTSSTSTPPASRSRSWASSSRPAENTRGWRRRSRGLPAKSGDKSAPAGATIDARDAPARRQDVLHVCGIADDAAVHRGHHVVRAQDADRDVAGADWRVHELEHLGHTNRPHSEPWRARRCSSTRRRASNHVTNPCCRCCRRSSSVRSDCVETDRAGSDRAACPHRAGDSGRIRTCAWSSGQVQQQGRGCCGTVGVAAIGQVLVPQVGARAATRSCSSTRWR